MFKASPNLFFLIALSISFSTHAESFGQSDEEALFGLYGDEEFISIATGVVQPVAKAPAVATVITAEDIQNMGAVDIDEALETVPGLHVTRDPFGYQPAYVFRGIYSKFNPQVLMLINGVPITNLFHGDRGLIWGGMPVHSVARIEVIRGPGSAVYGADAFAGTINVITKSYDDIDGTQAGVRLGSFDHKELWLLKKAEIGEGKLAVSLEFTQTDGQDEIIDSDGQTILDGAFGTNASLAPGEVNLSRENIDLRLDYEYDDWQFRAGLQRRSDFGNGAGIAEALDPHNRYLSERWNADINYTNDHAFDEWSFSAQLSYFDTSQEVEKDLIIFPPGVDLGGGVYPSGFIGNPEVYERHSRANATSIFTGFDRHTLRFGLGYYYGDLYKVKETKNFGIDPNTCTPELCDVLPPGADLIDVSDTPFVFLQEKTRINKYILIQDIWNVAADWEITAGIRSDDYSDFGRTHNPRVAVVWSVNHDLTAKVLYGKAFRSPSFTQTLAINNPSVLGNPDLDPEKMKSTELAFDYRPSPNVRYGLTFFHYEWEDIIQFVSDAGLRTKTAQNAGNQNGQGIEFESTWEPMYNLELQANYSVQTSDDKTDGGISAQAPQRQLFLSLLWKKSDNWQVYSQFNWVLDRRRISEDDRSVISDNKTVDLSIRRRRNGHPLTFAFSVKNLFNSDVREPSPWAFPAASIANDLPMAGRRILAEFEYQF